MNSETQVDPVAGPNFLDLPAEIRNMIYRLLLVADKTLGNEDEDPGSTPVWASFGEYHLQPAILGACLQVYREASPILMGQNTFGIYIYGFDHCSRELKDEDYSAMLNADEHWYANEDNAMTKLLDLHLDDNGFGKRTNGQYVDYNRIIQKFQRFEIAIEGHNTLTVGFHVNTLCNLTLRRMPALQHISIDFLRDTSHMEPTALGSFGMLRNLHSVVIYGVPIPFAKRLGELMLGNTPQENLNNMYRSLMENGVYVNVKYSDWKKAFIAMLEWDVQVFNEVRSTILSGLIQER